MQDITYRVPDVNRLWWTYPNGAVDNTYRNAASRVIVRRQISSGKPFPKSKPLPINPYQLIVQEYKLSQIASYKYTDGRALQAQGGYLSREAGGIDYSPQVDWDYLRNRAIEDLNEKTRGSLDLSVDIAEAHQVARMANMTQKVEDYTRVFTRRFGALKAAGNAWLEYTYGLKPLVSSVFGVADERLRHVMNKMDRFKGHAKVRILPTTTAMNTIDGISIIDLKKNGSGSHKAAVTYSVDMETPEHDITRFSSLNPASIAWELMPYSFVVDWFLDIGGYLRSVETGLLYRNRFRRGFTTYMTAADLTILISGGGSDLPNGVTQYSYTYQGTISSRYIERVILPSYPLPSPPSLKADLGSSRLLSAASLLAGLLGSGGNPARRQSWQNRDVQERVRKYQSKPDVPVWQQGYEHM
jgi:hypothetical protein